MTRKRAYVLALCAHVAACASSSDWLAGIAENHRERNARGPCAWAISQPETHSRCEAVHARRR